MAIGRPSDYTEELADIICSRIAEGESMRSICRDEDMPSTVTLFSWMRKHETFLNQYVRAKEESAESYADEIVYIADNESGEPLIIDGEPVMQDGKPVMIVSQAGVAHAKLKIDARKWVASKLKPKKYGDRLNLDGEVKHKHTVRTVDLSGSDGDD